MKMVVPHCTRLFVIANDIFQKHISIETDHRCLIRLFVIANSAPFSDLQYEVVLTKSSELDVVKLVNSGGIG